MPWGTGIDAQSRPSSGRKGVPGWNEVRAAAFVFIAGAPRATTPYFQPEDLHHEA